MSKLLYLDNAATTKTAPEVVEAMLPYFTEKFGNPSSVYSFAAANKEVINQQRDAIAEMIGAKSNEIYFTGAGIGLAARAEERGGADLIIVYGTGKYRMTGL